MKSIWVVLTTCGLFVAGVVGGCSSETSSRGGSGGSGGSDGGSETSVTVSGRGSPACHNWQNSYCDYIVKCIVGVTRQECDEQARGVTCRDDLAAADCAKRFRENTCDAPPIDCDQSDLADPAPAIAACNTYLQKVCEADTRCGGVPVQQCVAELAAQFDCSRIIAYTLSFEVCIAELAALPCTATDLPAVCDLVLITL